MSKVKRCFIENDIEIDEDDRYYIESSIDNNMDSFFDVVVLDAANNKMKVWNAINECSQIYLHTAFIGESAYLLEDMCELAIKKGIKDKTIINLRSSDAYLHMTDRGSRLLNILMKRNNVKYVSMDSDDFKSIIK